MRNAADGVLGAIGNTPLVELKRAVPGAPFTLFAKLEGLNPGGSMKDRPALGIIRAARAAGRIGPRTTIVESSSGNMGIGLAQVCRYYGLEFICVVDPKTTPPNIRLLLAYGARVDMVQPDPKTGEYLPARIARVKELVSTLPDAFWPNQYANEHNARAHWQTMHEIASALDGHVDYLFCATSTCGTLRGCAEYVRQHGLSTRIVAVDAVGSVIFGGRALKRVIPGHGAAIVPALYAPTLADMFVRVTDAESVIGCRRLLVREALLSGGSSGAVLMAIERVRHEIPDGAVCVAILPDRGERYIDTIFSDQWTRRHFGDIARHWAESDEPAIADLATCVA